MSQYSAVCPTIYISINLQMLKGFFQLPRAIKYAALHNFVAAEKRRTTPPFHAGSTDARNRAIARVGMYKTNEGPA